MRPWKQHELSPGKLLVFAHNSAIPGNHAKTVIVAIDASMLPLDVTVEGERVNSLAYAPSYQVFSEGISPRVLFLGFDTVLSTVFPEEISRYRQGGSEYIQKIIDECISYRNSLPNHVPLFQVLHEQYHYGLHSRARFLCTTRGGDPVQLGILATCRVALTALIKSDFIPMENMEATYRSRFPKRADEIIAKINAGI